MNICVIGSGYVGLVTGVCLAEMGNIVWCVDIDEERIDMLKKGEVPIYEPGLKELLRANINEGRLNFTKDIKEGIGNSLLVFIAVETPLKEDNSIDIRPLLTVAKSIGMLMEKYVVIVNKSTVPPGTANCVKEIIAEELRLRSKENIDFDVVSNPEFLKEGKGIEDFMNPDRIIIGGDSASAIELMKQLYQPITQNDHPIHIMDTKSAEITKYASNAMLATRISFMNELAELCDAVGADIKDVRIGVGSDKRIGLSFLESGIGYGGSCLPKDVKGLVQIGKEHGLDLKIIKAVDSVNEQQKQYLINIIIDRFGEDFRQNTFGIWGLAFKAGTDDMRESYAIVIINELLKRGAQVKVYDPVAIEQAKSIFGDLNKHIVYAEKMIEATRGVDALILVTDWQHFKEADLEEVKEQMKTPVFIDGRNQYDPKEMKEKGFEYYCIGRNCHAK